MQDVAEPDRDDERDRADAAELHELVHNVRETAIEVGDEAHEGESFRAAAIARWLRRHNENRRMVPPGRQNMNVSHYLGDSLPRVQTATPSPTLETPRSFTLWRPITFPS
ncbi:hypothetical protein GCM10010411_70670 [Actinomadura fulvescens]|uniref:Uncharacterized protein n=1 Tax=Actinomadura fulvescens TaxID=46160 RepID=A0ABN3QE54_9ACTN